MEDRLGVAVGLWASKILHIPLERKRLLRVPQNPAYGGAKISGDSVQRVCSYGILAVPLLASILRS